MQRLGTLHSHRWTERNAVVRVHGLHGVALALDKVYVDLARLELGTRHQASACRRIPRVAGLTDDLVGEVTEPAAVRERATGPACR